MGAREGLTPGSSGGGGGGAPGFAINEETLVVEPTATGDDAISIGDRASAAGILSIAVGSSAKDNGHAHSVVCGPNASSGGMKGTAVGYSAYAVREAVAVGDDATAFQQYSVGVGNAVNASALGAIAIGSDSTGNGAQATATNAIAIGDADATGTNAIAIGDGASATTQAVALGGMGAGQGSVGIGSSTSAGAFTTAIGFGAAGLNAQNALALGRSTNVGAHHGAVAIGTDSGGTGAQATAPNQFVLGTPNHTVEIDGTTVAKRIGVVAEATAAHSVAATDAGRVLEVDSADPATVTVEPDATLNLPIGTVVDIMQVGAGQVTVAAGAGVTINSAGGLLSTAAQWSQISLRKRAANSWVLVGDLA